MKGVGNPTKQYVHSLMLQLFIQLLTVWWWFVMLDLPASQSCNLCAKTKCDVEVRTSNLLRPA